MSAESLNDAVKQYSVCIDTWSLRHLTSAEEYPDEEYLDMSKSSSLKDRSQHELGTRASEVTDGRLIAGCVSIFYTLGPIFPVI